jgi:transforming growth factor-beta-induced protein
MFKRINGLALSAMLAVSGIGFAQTLPAQARNQNQAQAQAGPIKMAPLPSIVETAIATPQLSSLVRLVKAAKLVDTFNGKDQYTVFAPSNTAFAQLAKDPHDPKSVETLLASLEKNPQLAAVLGYHVVKGNILSEDLLQGQRFMTIQGQFLTVKINGKKIQLVTDSGSAIATVIKADVVARNGIVHVIDNVLIKKETPKYTVPANLTTFYSVLAATGIDSALKEEKKSFTVFAPTNTAFAALTSKPNDPKVVQTELAKLLENKKAVRRIVRKHIYIGTLNAADLKNNQVLHNILGEAFKVTITNGKVFLTDMKSGVKVQINQTDLPTPFSGIQHAINGVFTK